MGILEKISNKIGNTNTKAINMVRNTSIKKIKENIKYFEIKPKELYTEYELKND
jgi:hypothetical protein